MNDFGYELFGPQPYYEKPPCGGLVHPMEWVGCMPVTFLDKEKTAEEIEFQAILKGVKEHLTEMLNNGLT